MIKLIGSDSEMILQNHDGSFVSSHKFLKAPKDQPKWFDNFNLQNDGALLEFAINPVDTLDNFNTYIEDAIEASQELVSSHNVGLARLSHVVYPDSALESYEERLLGCQPSFSCWDMNEHKIDVDSFAYKGLHPNFRTTGGHVHIGFNHPKNILCLDEDTFRINLGRMLDVYLGTWSVLVDPETERRKLYGQAGDVRMKSYGIEYRSLSNFWIWNKDTREELWHRVHAAYKKARTHVVHDVINPDELIQGINEYNKGFCKKAYDTMLSA